MIYCDNVHLSENGDSVVIIDQTMLPAKKEYIELRTKEDIFDAIYYLKVRGAPAIGICAGYGMYAISKKIMETEPESFYRKFMEAKEYIDSSRPTAVNLSKALNRMEKVATDHKNVSAERLLELLKAESVLIQTEDIEMCRAISEYGLTLIKSGDGILTHCNAGPLATSKYGTGLGTLFLGKERGVEFNVFCDETRPLLQGARLTAYELYEAGINCTLICDNTAGMLMRDGKIDACFVGCDRVAANGDTANKIGTSSAAVLAKYYNVPFYVFCPSSTIDFNCKTGGEIVIEERSAEEINGLFFKAPIAPAEVKCFNPAFDVTEAELITAIVTEKGVCRFPYTESLAKLFGEENV